MFFRIISIHKHSSVQGLIMEKIFILCIIIALSINVKAVTFFDLLKSYGIRTAYDIHTVSLPTQNEYDFIIIGSGSGGSTVANRLSEIRKWRILLLEAGQPEGVLNQIPILLANFHQTDYNWGYKVEKQENACFGMTNGQCTWPRGKSLGGTSSINAMIHTRGNRFDYDTWAALGNNGWSYDEILPYFRKSENFRVPVTYNTSFHGKDGYLCVEHIPYHTPLSTEFLKAGEQLGYQIIDYNGPEQIGFSYLQVNMDHGTRCSASRAYLRVKRNNLDIVTRALVTKILFNDNKRAYGVEYVKNGVKRIVRASKEIILSAGTIDSAKLLMLSGIGPKEHLEQLGIDVIKDSKVGFHLYDHIGFFGLTFVVNASVTLTARKMLSPTYTMQYLRDRSGPFSIPLGAEALAFIKSKYALDDRPDIELLFFSGGIHSDNGLAIKKSYGISDKVYNQVFKPLENRDAWSVWPIVQHPRSRGRITLKSKNPYDNPILQPNFFTHPADVEIILEGIKYAIKVAATEPLQKYQSKLYDVKIPGCTSHKFASDDYFRCAIKTLPAMLNHEIGTAKMGPVTDPEAVVDPELRVYGVKGLRVVDASVMPTMPVGHINAGIYMIGEKAADMIKLAWNN
ncbi:glucose dehydrogenase [FAD, quinone]-like [Chelonus insularis]|uniref:glucose dehydrogenase [FAD, quinone]-like n=1 Tax=Chelonus insularis TaxID=460826 RepID=UPI00158F6433|nr:glucose dehydrogenase [FAD, quinone]-like [Chelonus insularis]